MLTKTQRNFIKDSLKSIRIKRTRNKTMIKKRLKTKFIPLPETADIFINDFDLLCTYFSDDVFEMLLKSLIKKYGKEKIIDYLTRQD